MIQRPDVTLCDNMSKQRSPHAGDSGLGVSSETGKRCIEIMSHKSKSNSDEVKF